MSAKKDITNELELTYEQRPDIINEAISEYLENAPEDLENDNTKESLKEKLKEKLKNKDYHRTFSLSLLQIASLISGAMLIQKGEIKRESEDESPENRYNKLRKQVLFEARNDDFFIQTMRLYYLNSIDYSEVGNVLSSDLQRNCFAERIKSFKKDYIASKVL